MSEDKSLWEIFKYGILEGNPIFVLALSLCPALAVTSNIISALGMGFSVMFVITCNNVVVSIVRNWVNKTVRVPVYIVSIATIVTLVQLILQALWPEVYKSLSIYLALIVVFAIILARAEVFAAKNPVIPSFFDGLGMGVGFTGALLLIAAIRELFGNGTLAGIQIFGAWYNPALVMVLPPGSFITIGLLIAIFNMIHAHRNRHQHKRSEG